MTLEGAGFYRFLCDDCGAAVQFPRSDYRGARGEYWDCVDALKARGWRCSARYRSLSPGCKREADTGLLDRPVRSVGR
jgi:hypothetical protein